MARWPGCLTCTGNCCLLPSFLIWAVADPAIDSWDRESSSPRVLSSLSTDFRLYNRSRPSQSSQWPANCFTALKSRILVSSKAQVLVLRSCDGAVTNEWIV